MLIAQLAVIGNGVIDSIMAGRLSTPDLAAVGVAASIQVTVVMALAGVLFALPPIIARLHGAGDEAGVGAEVGQSLWIAAVLALLGVLLLVNAELYLPLIRLEAEVESRVRAYLNHAAWGVPATMAFRLFIGFSTGIGQPRPVMLFNLLSLSLKAPLNSWFMHGGLGVPAMGSAGCAVASSLDAWLIAGMAWVWCLNDPGHARYGLRLRFPPPDRAALTAFLRLGLPIALTFLADVTSFTFMALFIARLGPTASAAHQIASNLAVLAFMVPLSIGNAAAILAGKALGAGQARSARQAALTGIRTGLLCALPISLGLWTAGGAIISLYTADASVRAAAQPLILLVGIYHLFDALQVTAVNALRGYRESTVPMLIYTVTLWGLGLGGGYLLGLSDALGEPRGAAGFWIAGASGLAVVGILVSLYLNWRSRKAIADAA